MAAQKKTAQNTISSTQAQRQFGDVLRRVHSGQEHIVVEQNGLPLAVLISVHDYDELMQERELREEREKRAVELSRKFGDEAKRRGITEEQLPDNLQGTKQTDYREKNGNTARS